MKNFYFANQYFGIFILWLIATLVNIDKAFHIDDTFHLEAAQWIAQHPLRPMSGLILWNEGYEPIHNYNQPPLYFYLLAIIGNIFGYHEIALHIFQSGFTFLAILYFYKIVKITIPKHTLLITSFLVLSPAFLINQNVMVDVPLLSLHLIFIYLLLKENPKYDWIRYELAAFVLSVALLIKYTSLPLIIILLVHPIIHKKKKYLFILLLPITVLITWSFINFFEFGSLHLYRPTHSLTLFGISLKAMAFIVCLGAVAPFSIAFISGFINKYRKSLKVLVPVGISLFISLILLTYMDSLSERNTKRILWMCFFGNGFTLLYLFLDTHPLQNLLHNVSKNMNSQYLVLILWLSTVSAFIILFAPFMATRHILLIMPPIIILGAELLIYTSKTIKIVTVILTASLSLVLSTSDWLYAHTYRTQALTLKSKMLPNVTVWTVGFWGWQWYSKNAGMKPYIAGKSLVRENDYFIIPVNIAPTAVVKVANLKQLKEETIKSNFITFFSCSNFPSMYSSDYANPPWKLSKAPIDTFKIYQVKRAFR